MTIFQDILNGISLEEDPRPLSPLAGILFTEYLRNHR